MPKLKNKLREVLHGYSKSFSNKVYVDGFNDTDVLMNAFGVTQKLKSENKQYWGRELGKCWENLLRNLFEVTCPDFQPPKRFGADEPADFFVGNDAIDTKYRVGSGDSGTLKKFEQYG
ncbi:MAG TPA: restriction endonuclease, partial [Phaeodactylibacter sp.]|nr:restriction endonuclease [Phaeodactylibacter sp.]